MSIESNYTIKQSGTYEVVIQKSKFIAHFKRVETEEEAQAFIQATKKEHWNANHNCSAYIIGERNEHQKANDDGEPSGTAGMPMLEVLRKRHLKDTVVVVTRYFGGIKLGGGGLIRAYGGTVSEGLDAIGIVERLPMQQLTLTVDYTWIGKVENELRQSSYLLDDIIYADLVTFHVSVPVEETEEALAWLTDMTNGQGQLQTHGIRIIERDFKR
ncbi:YigZ family protein [Exiguobacterium profundum]|uniref:YigZ family protein n=1 Tax=Exiguobacterium TaxID=33986 RepID=UPI0018DA4C5B|nr:MULTISPECIES: YigZ family protein [Exiguobacterium]MCT4799368.1 YigZ family protein [Exiguobacterium profundum]MCV9900009.1 YigZ family protein [Exiguobacterium sp. N5]MDT0192252.1 YigZ family protein [Exiguobacterium sp. BG5(2022)]QPI68449.1 YigZ family protein [Exiguobacterium sp. PBE]